MLSWKKWSAWERWTGIAISDGIKYDEKIDLDK